MLVSHVREEYTLFQSLKIVKESSKMLMPKNRHRTTSEIIQRTYWLPNMNKQEQSIVVNVCFQQGQVAILNIQDDLSLHSC